MEISYTRVGDYQIPDIAVPDTPQYTLGKYGCMRRSCLKEHRPVLWYCMSLDGTLWDHLVIVDRIRNERMDTLIEGMKRTRGITEKLKAKDQLRWVAGMNNIQAPLRRSSSRRWCADEGLRREPRAVLWQYQPERARLSLGSHLWRGNGGPVHPRGLAERASGPGA